MITTEDFRLEFDADGTLNIRGRDGWQEPNCVECGKPIRWCLDMFSFRTLRDGGYALGHARCLWLPESLEREARKARA